MTKINIVTLLAFALSSIISLNLPARAETQTNIVHCGVVVEQDSKLKKTIRLEKFGIAMQVPANYRAIAITDGSVTIVDNGTYKAINCHANHPNAVGSSYDYLSVYKSSENFLYANVYDKVPDKENIFIIWKKTPIDNTYKYYRHEVKLRIKTNKGIVEIERIFGEPVEDGSINVEEVLKVLLEIGKNIQIL